MARSVTGIETLNGKKIAEMTRDELIETASWYARSSVALATDVAPSTMNLSRADSCRTAGPFTSSASLSRVLFSIRRSSAQSNEV